MTSAVISLSFISILSNQQLSWTWVQDKEQDARHFDYRRNLPNSNHQKNHETYPVVGVTASLHNKIQQPSIQINQTFYSELTLSKVWKNTGLQFKNIQHHRASFLFYRCFHICGIYLQYLLIAFDDWYTNPLLSIQWCNLSFYQLNRLQQAHW